jgi:hypothetical protein
MSAEITFGLIIFGCLMGSVGLGIYLRRILSEHYLSADTKDAVKLAMGLVATMSALVLGLLVTSVKGAPRTPAEVNSSSWPLKSRISTGC